MIYQLSYELKTPEKDYTSLYTFLEKVLGGIHVLRDTWWIKYEGEKSLDELCESIRKEMGENDVFFLSIITPDKINGWMASSNWAWLSKNKFEQPC